MMPTGATFEAFLIGQQIRSIRRGKDVSQATLAKQTGVSAGWIGRIERGLDMPNLTDVASADCEGLARARPRPDSAGAVSTTPASNDRHNSLGW
jgi:DNA-binding XRE family transcriptional regulator